MSAVSGKFFDRVMDTAASVSGSTVTLNNSAPTGFQTFGTPYANTDVVPAYLISDGTNWEVSYGAYTSSGTTLARASTPLRSSNAGAQVVSFSGTITVACVSPSDMVNSPLWGIGSGNMRTNFFANALSGAAGPAVNTVNYAPVRIDQWFSTFEVHVNIVTLAANVSAVFDVGVYDNLAGAPNNRLAQATGLNCSTTGGATGDNSSGTLTPASPKPPGIYWPAFVCRVLAPTMEGVSGAGGQQAREIIGATSTTDTTLNKTGYSQSSSTLPSSATPVVLTGNNIYIGVKVAL